MAPGGTIFHYEPDRTGDVLMHRGALDGHYTVPYGDIAAFLDHAGAPVKARKAVPGLAVVLGGADCLWEDVDALQQMTSLDAAVIVACNDAGYAWPGRLDHWATMHPEELDDRKAKREANGYPDGYETWTRPYPYGLKDREKMCDHVLDGWGGSSGLLAVGVALELGAPKVVVCGVPMDARPHFNREGEWGGATKYRDRWVEQRETMRGRVRSMSGWTKALLGGVTPEWLEAT